MIDKDFTIRTLQKLVNINSVNPSLDDSGKGELEIGHYIASVLQEMGIEAEVEELLPGRLNVTGYLKGSGNGKSLTLNAHMDTVGVKGMGDPYSGKIEDGKLYGRGAYDMKGSIAAILGAAKAMVDNNMNIAGDVYLSFVADEEYASIGTEAFLKKVKTNAAIVTEPSDLHLCLAHRGFGVYKVTTTGKTAHGGNHHLGLDANMKMGLLMAAIHEHSKTLSDFKNHALCGQASIHVPMVKGGRSIFVYSHECEIIVERRTIPGETESEVRQEIQKLMDEISLNEPDFKAKLELVLWRSPYEVSADASIVKACMDAGNSRPSFPKHFIGHTWWEDSALFGDAGVETVILGPKGGGIHEDIEWVETESVTELAEILLSTIQSYCQ